STRRSGCPTRLVPSGRSCCGPRPAPAQDQPGSSAALADVGEDQRGAWRVTAHYTLRINSIAASVRLHLEPWTPQHARALPALVALRDQRLSANSISANLLSVRRPIVAYMSASLVAAPGRGTWRGSPGTGSPRSRGRPATARAFLGAGSRSL